MTRRDFLRGAGAAAAAGAFGACGAGDAPARPPEADPGKRPERSRVVLVRHEKAVGPGGGVNGEVLAGMLDRAVTALFDAPDASTAWAGLFGPSDRVGIKSNVWRFLRTPPALERALRERVTGAGVAREAVSVDDRGVLRDPVFRTATALVNVRPLRTHHWAGVGSLIKNYIMFSENPPQWHGDACADLAGLWDLPLVKGKTRLNVLLMLTPLFHSKGPHDYSPRYVWSYGGLLVGTDPVAVDATGLRILQAKRAAFFGEERPLETPPRHIRIADERWGLGHADPSRIDLVRLGWSEGALLES